MPLPTEEEIRRRAIELWKADMLRAGLVPEITPSDEELKEGSYWERARLELMHSEAERLLSEVERARAEELEFIYNELNKMLEEIEKAKSRIEELSRARERATVEPFVRSLLTVPYIYRVEVQRKRIRIFTTPTNLDKLKDLLKRYGIPIIGERKYRTIAYVDVPYSPEVLGKEVRPVTPEEVYRRLWAHASAYLRGAGLRPEEYEEKLRPDIMALAESVARGLMSEEEARHRLEAYLREIVEAARPPPVAPPTAPPPTPPAAPPTAPPEVKELREAIAELRETVEALAGAIAGRVPWLPIRIQPAREAYYSLRGWIAPPVPYVEPRVVIRTDPKTGERFLGFSDEVIYFLERIFPLPLDYWFASPRRQHEEFGWPDTETFLEEVLKFKDRTVPPEYVPWLEECLRRLREAKRRRGGVV